MQHDLRQHNSKLGPLFNVSVHNTIYKRNVWQRRAGIVLWSCQLSKPADASMPLLRPPSTHIQSGSYLPAFTPGLLPMYFAVSNQLSLYLDHVSRLKVDAAAFHGV